MIKDGNKRIGRRFDDNLGLVASGLVIFMRSETRRLQPSLQLHLSTINICPRQVKDEIKIAHDGVYDLGDIPIFGIIFCQVLSKGKSKDKKKRNHGRKLQVQGNRHASFKQPDAQLPHCSLRGLIQMQHNIPFENEASRQEAHCIYLPPPKLWHGTHRLLPDLQIRKVSRPNQSVARRRQRTFRFKCKMECDGWL